MEINLFNKESAGPTALWDHNMHLAMGTVIAIKSVDPQWAGWENGLDHDDVGKKFKVVDEEYIGEDEGWGCNIRGRRESRKSWDWDDKGFSLIVDNPMTTWEIIRS